MYDRTLKKVIKQVSNTFPILLLTGPRQVGKTTLLEVCAENNCKYVTLDDLEIRAMAINDPGFFVQKYPPPLVIDEVQYAPELFSYLKIMVDREKKNGMYWLTASQKFHLMKGVKETLAGRVAILDLLGLSKAEIDGRSDKSEPFLPSEEWIKNAKKGVIRRSVSEMYSDIWKGSFPAIRKKNAPSRDIFYRSYVQTYVQRDVKDAIGISNDLLFSSFLTAIAARTGQILNYSDLARDIGIDNKTVKSWLSVLEASGLIYLLQPYHNNLTKRVIKSPKLYFLDTGLCAYLTKWSTAESLEVGAMSGAILETYLFAELLKTYWHNGLSHYFYYYRDLDKREVDLIIEESDTLYPIEFKKTATPSKTASKNFSLLEKFGKRVGHGAVMCFVENDVPLSRDVTAIPVWYL